MKIPPARSRRATARVAAALACVLTLASFTAACGSDPQQAANGVASLDDTDATAESNANPADSTDAPDGTAGSANDDDTVGSVDPEDAFVDYTQCMRDNGYDMPDPEIVSEDADGNVTAGGPRIATRADDGEAGPSAVIVGPGGRIDFDPSDEAYVEANEVCGEILEAARGSIDIDPEVQAEQREQMLEFAECMREHGIDFPDPVFDGDGGVRVQIGDPNEEGGNGPRLDDESFQAASEECGDLFGGAVAVGSASVGAQD